MPYSPMDGMEKLARKRNQMRLKMMARSRSASAKRRPMTPEQRDAQVAQHREAAKAYYPEK